MIEETLSQKLFLQPDGKKFAYADEIRKAIKKLKEDLNKDLKDVLDGAIVIYKTKKKGVMINKKDVELDIIGCFISNKIKKIDKIFGGELSK